MPHNILLYADDKTATGSMTEALKKSFNANDYNLIRIRADDIRKGILRDQDSRLFILPGIVGEISPYTAQLDKTALQEIHDFVTLKPNVILTVCAGSYFVSRETVYDTGRAPPRGKISLAPFFNGIARGPVSTYGRAADMMSDFDDVVVVPVQFKNDQGQWETTQTCYGNGPALYPDDPNDASIDIMARYADVAGNPAALLRQASGKGAVYLSCILPEIGYQYIMPRLELNNARALMNDLKPHEQGRQKLWDTLTTRIQQDLAR